MGQTFEEHIGLHLDDLYSAALCFTLDRNRAEDLLQEASIRAFHELSRRGLEKDFRVEMLKVLVTTYLHRQRREGHDPLESDVGLLSEMFDDAWRQDAEPFPEPGTTGYRILRDWIGEIWSELDDGDRLVLWLADVERMRHAVVASITGLDEQQVRLRHHRARTVLSRGAIRRLRSQSKRGAGS